ncbi:MAG: DUF6088 family protein [Chitinophagaceae bacterium]
MKIASNTRFIVDRLPSGYVFTYDAVCKELNQREAVIKTLNRMVASGKLAKLSKGKFYKPEITSFGLLEPNAQQIVKDLLVEKGKIVGYLTGYSIYNQLGLSSQVSYIIQIGRNYIRPSIQRSNYTIKFVQQKNTITKENIPFLQLLDALRTIRQIPDANPESSCKRFLAILKKYSENDIRKIVRLALKYPPATRALLGAMLEKLNRQDKVNILFESLNPISKYKIPSVSNVLFSAQKWNIYEPTYPSKTIRGST